MLHSVPLWYDFMTKLHNMLPEALEVGGQCVQKQVAKLLRCDEMQIEEQLEQLARALGQARDLND